jgi:hypothetical protein
MVAEYFVMFDAPAREENAGITPKVAALKEPQSWKKTIAIILRRDTFDFKHPRILIRLPAGFEVSKP